MTVQAKHLSARLFGKRHCASCLTIQDEADILTKSEESQESFITGRLAGSGVEGAA